MVHQPVYRTQDTAVQHADTSLSLDVTEHVTELEPDFHVSRYVRYLPAPGQRERHDGQQRLTGGN